VHADQITGSERRYLVEAAGHCKELADRLDFWQA
jgi:hypothetical protein